MKKVLIFAPTAPTSGITQYILNMLSVLDTENIRFDILSFKNHRLKKWAEENGTEYFEFDISPYKDPKGYNAFLKNVFSKGYDVVHFHLSSISDLRIFKFAKKSGAEKIIVHSHNSFTDVPSKLRRIVFGNLHKILRVFANKYSDYKCACSPVAAEWMFGKNKGKTAIIMNNAVDISKFAYNENYRNDIRKDLNIQTKYVIGHIGRFSVQKNQNFLVDTFKVLSENRDDCTLLLIGNGELTNSVKQHTKDLQLEDKVLFVDFQEDIYRYYSVMDLFVMPSLFEGLPITLVESQANSLSSLVSDAITKNSDLTGLVEFKSLNDGTEKWAERINSKLENCERIDYTEKIEEKGFSLRGQAKVVSDLYFG